MDSSHNPSSACVSVILILISSFLLSSCSKVASVNEAAYVLPERVKLKSSTAQASRILGELKSGDKVTIIGRSTSEDGTAWAKVAIPGGESGWVEARYFVREGTVEESRRIDEKIRTIQTQAVGKSKATLKLRLTPDRANESNVATMMPSGAIVEIVGRERKPRPVTSTTEVDSDAAPAKTPKNNPEIKYDDWYLVRLKDYAVLPAGWIYGGSVGLEIPPEILYFSSTGRRITGWQKIATVTGNDSKTGDHYLILERKVVDADDRVDFDRVKVLAYDPSTRNYVTPFQENVLGRFPLTLKMEGTRGRFQLITIDKNNQQQTLTYGIEMLEAGRVKVTKPGAKPTKGQ